MVLFISLTFADLEELRSNILFYFYAPEETSGGI